VTNGRTAAPTAAAITVAIPLHRTPDPPPVPNPQSHVTAQGVDGRENGLCESGTGGSGSDTSVTFSSVQRVLGVPGDGRIGGGSGGYHGTGFGDMGRSEGAAAAAQCTPLRGAVAVVVTLAVGMETPATAGHSVCTPSPGPQLPLPPRAADSDPLLLPQAARGCWDLQMAN